MAYDRWGGSWGASWALFWTGETVAPPVTDSPKSSAGGKASRPARVIGYLPPERKKKEPKKELEKARELGAKQKKTEEPYVPVGNLGAVIQFPEKTEAPNPSVGVPTTAAESLSPEYTSLLARVESQAREIDALRDEIKATAELKVLEKLEEEARLLSQSELESLLLLMVVE